MSSVFGPGGSGGGGSGNVSGPGSSTDNAIVRWDGTTGTLIQDSSWVIGDDGRLQYTGATAGTAASPLLRLTTGNTGFYTGTDQLNLSLSGTRYHQWDLSTYTLYHSTATNYLEINHAGTIANFRGNGLQNAFGFQCINSSSQVVQYFGTQGSIDLWQWSYLTDNTSTGYRGTWYFYQNPTSSPASIDMTVMTGTRAGAFAIGEGSQKSVKFSVWNIPDTSNIGGTTTANAATTITGSSTAFLEQLGIGDRISLSSDAATYSYVSAIASNTSLTVASALGDGTSQTINRKRGISSWFNASGTIVALLDDRGTLTVGEPITGPSFFPNDANKFITNGTMTAIANVVGEIVQIGAISVFGVNPVANTGSGLGASVYAAQGFNLSLTSNKTYIGLPIGGYDYAISGVGAFGQANVQTSGTIDGACGLLCTGTHQGGGAALSDLVGGIFSVSTSSDLGSSGSLSRMVGGYFTCFTDIGGISPTTGIGGWFKEPFNIGASTITNKTSAFIDGTISFKQADSSSTGNIDAFTPLFSYNYMTGAAPVLRGISNDTFNKVLIFDFANTATITNESGTPAAALRITTGTGADLLLVKSACLVYNTTTSRWRVQWWRV